WRRHRARPSDRRLGRARPHDAPVRPQGQAADDRTRHPVSRWRQCRGPQRGDALMHEAQTAALSLLPRALTARRALAVLLGAALVAAAAQISVPLPGTPVPVTLQPLAVLVVGGLLGAPLGAASLLLYLALGAAGLGCSAPWGRFARAYEGARFVCGGVSRVAVVGAGTMGNGIAHVFAQAGWDTALVDVAPDALSRALKTIQANIERLIKKGAGSKEQGAETLGRIRTSTSLDAVKDAEFVVEAASENSKVKLALFRELDRTAPPGAILASNTSSISITALAATTQRPAQVIGMHFMNPVPVMQLVEVI